MPEHNILSSRQIPVFDSATFTLNPATAISCGPPPDAPANGQNGTFNNTTFMSTVTYSCNTGYNLQGSSTLTCNASGQWSPSVPTCNGESTL